jgi:hypothetical protein
MSQRCSKEKEERNPHDTFARLFVALLVIQQHTTWQHQPLITA